MKKSILLLSTLLSLGVAPGCQAGDAQRSHDDKAHADLQETRGQKGTRRGEGKTRLVPAETLTAIILGSGSPKYNPDRSGPAVLIRYNDTNILVDTGNGVQARLDEMGVRFKSLDGILFTHHHLDHNEEFFPVFIRSLIGDEDFVLAGPPPMSAMAKSTFDLYGDDISYRIRKSGRSLSDLKDNFDLNELSGNESFMIGDIKVTSAEVNHTIAANALRFDAGGKSVVVTGDLIYSSSIADLAENADYMIIDSGGVIKDGQERKANRSSRDNTDRAHVTLDETVRMASEAGVKNLVLTHFTNGNIDEDATRAELQSQGYVGPVQFAYDGLSLSNGGASPALVQNPRSNTRSGTRENACTQTAPARNSVSITLSGNQRIVTSNALPSHKIGSFPGQGNPNHISAQSKRYEMDASPQKASSLSFVSDLGIEGGRPAFVFGVALNGVKIEPTAAEYFRGSTGPVYEWTKEAMSPSVFLGEDCNNAHVQRTGEYHYHAAPTGLVASLAGENASKMTLIGWAADGFPIYYKYSDVSGTVQEMHSSYRLKSGSRPGNGQTAPSGAYDGEYVADYEYVDGLGDLDQCNGRMGSTPEFPGGTYHYMITTSFPFVGRCLVGTPDASFKMGGGPGGAEGGSRGDIRPPRNEQGAQQTPRSNQPRRDASEVFSRMDRDGDGRISKAEARGRLAENFDRRDRNGDGYISQDEIRR